MVKRLLLLIFLFLASTSERAEGAASRALSLEELTERADLIAHIRVVGERSRFEGERIVTEIDLVVERSIADIASRRELRVIVPGGVVGGIGMRVEGAPRLAKGEEAVVFAFESARGLRTVGLAQGVFPIERRGEERLVLPGGRGMALYERGPSGRLMRTKSAIDAPMPLGGFISLIEQELER